MEITEIMKKSKFYCDLSDHVWISIEGKEHREWFHRISSQASLNAAKNTVIPCAFLTANGGAKAFFEAIIFENSISLLANPWNIEEILKYLDFSHFGEEISFKKQTDYYTYFFSCDKFDKDFLDFNNAFAYYHKRFAGYILASKEMVNTKAILKSWQDLRFDLFQKGEPISGLDMTEKNMILSANLWDYVTDTKGCYPGQETIAKVITYGRIPKKIYRAKRGASKGEKILADGKACGYITSAFSYKDNDYAWLEATASILKKADKICVGAQEIEVLDK